MNAVMSVMGGFDLGRLLPSVGSFMGSLKFFMMLFILIGPLLMLGLGATYYKKPPKEANYSWGFRTYFSMGSEEVWRFTQKLAGKIWMLLGGAMSAVALVVGIVLCFFSARVMVVGAVWIISIELALVLASWIAINSIVLKFYDKEGNRRPESEIPQSKFLKD